MNAGFVLSYHGSFEEALVKMGGDFSRVSETLIIKKYSDKFDKVFVFTRDSKRFGGIFPQNVRHVRLFSRPLFWLVGWIVVLLFAIRYRIKIVYVECGPGLPAIFMVNKLSKAKVLLNYDNRLYNTANNSVKFSVFLAIEKALLHFVDFIVVASKEIENFVERQRMGGKILRFMKKGIVVDRFEPEKVKPDKIYDKIRGPSLIFISRLDPVKDPITLLKGYKIAKKKIPRLSLIVCGDGSLRNECEKLADKDVYFMGFVKDVPSVLKGADIHVMSSVYDASPRSLLEAMCMGLPSIATNVGGIPNYLDNKTGILIKPQDPDVLAEKIVYLVKNPEKAKEMGRNARSKILKYHNLEKNLERELNFILKELRNHKVRF